MSILEAPTQRRFAEVPADQLPECLKRDHLTSPYFPNTSRAALTVVAVLCAVGGTALMVGQALVQAELTVRVSDHLARVLQSGGDLDPAKTAADYVQTGPGFVLCFALLAVVAVVNGVGWWRVRPRPALVAT